MLKRTRKLLAILAVAVIVIFSGCANSDTAASALKEYFPVAEGSTWSYAGEGNEFAAFNRTVMFVGENRAQLKEDNGGTVSSSVYEIGEEKIVRIFFQGEQYEPLNLLEVYPNDELIILQAPLKVGAKWETANTTREIVDVNASVETPAGKFDKCLQIRISTEGSTVDEFYKAGVGLVKREFNAGETKVISTLEKYNIGQ